MDGVTVQNLFSLIESMRREIQLGQDNLSLADDEDTQDGFDDDGPFDDGPFDGGGMEYEGDNIAPLHPVKN